MGPRLVPATARRVAVNVTQEAGAGLGITGRRVSQERGLGL